MLDRLNRPLRDLRISVTDRCNLRCRYCMPREVYGPGHEFLPRAELLSFEEITRLAGVFAAVGVRKLRLTGGEPLLRRELASLVAMLARLGGIEEVALTTNGLLLAEKAHALARAGLARVTVSLDALDDVTLADIAGARVSAARVLAGIDAAIDAGLAPVKVNMVVRRGVNEHAMLEMAERFRNSGVVLRLIEYMDVGSTNGWRLADVVRGDEMLATISDRWPLEALARAGEGGVASRYRYCDGAGEIGVIHSVSEPFCGSCTRARLSADGMLYTCLFARQGSDLRALLRGGASDAELERRVAGVWRARADAYSERRALASHPAPGAPEDAGAKLEMSYIGG